MNTLIGDRVADGHRAMNGRVVKQIDSFQIVKGERPGIWVAVVVVSFFD